MNTSRELKLSVIVAVYRREDELRELLESLSLQTDKDFELLIVDDGSPQSLEPVALAFADRLRIRYFYKANSGPGKTRNYGMERAEGNYFIFLDSDTIIPSSYIATVRRELNENYVDAYGGPDAAEERFSDLQKAITFSMTSFLTTGGIRGGKRHIGKFQPRSFNMGISREAFLATGGFGNLRIGEDPDLSLTLWEKGFGTRLLPEAKVYHKRRTSLRKFAKQVYEFGAARPILNQRHPGSARLTFWFPSVFICGLILALLLVPVALCGCGHSCAQGCRLTPLALLIFPGFYALYIAAVVISATLQFKSIKVGILSKITTLIQFSCYGYGFLKSQVNLNILKRRPEDVFPGHFYKEK